MKPTPFDSQLHLLRSAGKIVGGRVGGDIEAARLSLYRAIENGDNADAERWIRALRAALEVAIRDRPDLLRDCWAALAEIINGNGGCEARKIEPTGTPPHPRDALMDWPDLPSRKRYAPDLQAKLRDRLRDAEAVIDLVARVLGPTVPNTGAADADGLESEAAEALDEVHSYMRRYGLPLPYEKST